MKNNTTEIRMLVEKALQSLPFDNVLQGTRFHLKCALNEINKVESKRHKREKVRIEVEKEYKEKMASLFIPPENSQLALNAIDEMISQEEDKIKRIKENKNKPTQTTKIDLIED